MIGIITVFYSENYGSVLQSFALRKYINNQGLEAVYINTRNKYSSHSMKRMLMSSSFRLIHGDIKNTVLLIKKYKNFCQTLDMFTSVEINDDNLDLLIVGSDTVWDVDSKYFMESQDIFWPISSSTRVMAISYGASVANSTPEHLRKLSYPLKCLEQLNAISVRDQYSYEVVTSVTEKPVSIVCDPTLLLKMDDYQDLFVTTPKESYIAVYLFEELDPKCIKIIKDWAQKKHLRIISICKHLQWCDEVVDPSVENFVSYIKDADYVITNTFHGTIFSIIFNKQFTCFGAKKKKISEFLRMIHLTDRIIDDKNIVSGNLDSSIDYQVVENELDAIREDSYRYLNQHIFKVK